MAIQKIFSCGEFEGDGVFDFDPATDYIFSVFSDLHHGEANYNVFRCTDALNRLAKIIEDGKDSEFFLSLGDFADNLADGITLYEELKTALSRRQIRLYKENVVLADGERYLYLAVGNHEIAFQEKSTVRDYTPIVDGVGNVYAFSQKGTLFVCYDALFTADTGSEKPDDIRPCLCYTIPDKTIGYLKKLIDENIAGCKSIVAFSHICLKNIEENAKQKWLSLLLSYNRPVYLFEGHAHRENYQEYGDEQERTAKVFTLPAVCDNDTYNRYEVVMRDGKLLRINAYEKPAQ